MSKLREHFLVNHTKIMKDNGGLMDLTVSLKGYLDTLRN